MTQYEEDMAEEVMEAVERGEEIVVLVPTCEVGKGVNAYLSSEGMVRRRQDYVEYENGAKIWFISVHSSERATRGTWIDGYLVHEGCWHTGRDITRMLDAIQPCVRP